MNTDIPYSLSGKFKFPDTRGLGLDVGLAKEITI